MNTNLNNLQLKKMEGGYLCIFFKKVFFYKLKNNFVKTKLGEIFCMRK